MTQPQLHDVLPFSDEVEEYLDPVRARILADRYLGKGGEAKEGALVVAMLEVEQFGKKRTVRELGKIVSTKLDKKGRKTVQVHLADDEYVWLAADKVDVLKEKTPKEMWRRIAKGVSEPIVKNKDQWEENFTWLQSDMMYIPGGRINASMGVINEETGEKQQTTSYNCFVIPSIGPNPKEFAKSFGRTLEIQARSGGVGMNVSLIQPKGTLVTPKEVRRSDLQLVMDVWHPDLFNFINEETIDNIPNPYKHSMKVVRISSRFREAVENNLEWTFEFPDTTTPDYDNLWNGDIEDWKSKGLKVVEYETMNAKELLEKLYDAKVAIVDGAVFASVIKPGDSRSGIAEALGDVWETLLSNKQAAVVLSTMRPKHTRVLGVNGRSSGAFSWGALYDRANWAYAQGFGPVAIAQIMSIGCLLVIQGGSRRGALMIVLNDWHADILDFINAKKDMSMINGANISVGISEEFMEAQKNDLDWNLGYVSSDLFEKYEKEYYIDQDDFQIVKTMKAEAIWDEMMEAAHKSAEPGIIFMGRYNSMSNSHYYSGIIATNPCGRLTF